MSYALILPNLTEKPSVTEYEARLIWAAALKPVYRLLIRLLWFTGLRITEALILTPNDVLRDSLDFSLNVWTEKVGKSKVAGEDKPDKLPLPREIGLEFYDFIKSTGIKPHERIFPFSRQTAYRQVQACARRAGLINWKQIHPHSFRHGFVYDKVKKNINPMVVAKLARHTRIQTTMGYYTPTEADLRQAMER